MKVIDSKYSLVTIAAKRARQFKEDEDPRLEKYSSHKYVGKALEEINAGILTMSESDNHK